MNNGLVKLLYSSSFEPIVDVSMHIMEDPAKLTKSASTVFECPYEDMAPDKDHVGIHLVALGDFEHYGSNRNGDSFPKQACITYHDTFTKYANLYRHHRNKDPEKRLGQVVKSAYNPNMGRIELFIHANREKARDELDRMDKEGEIPFSMACKVAFDRCSECNTLRRSSSDPDQCDHVKYQLGKMGENGKVIATHNDEPKFFDISFVGRPADRIAWDLKVAADEPIDSVKLAEAAGVWVPDHLAITSADSLAKFEFLKKMAELETAYLRIEQSKTKAPGDRYLWELRKAAAEKVSDDILEELRTYSPSSVFAMLAKSAAILDVDSFFKYAMGPQYKVIEPYMPGVHQAVKTIYTRITKAARCQDVCNDTIYDVNPEIRMFDKSAAAVKAAASSLTLLGPDMERRIIERTIDDTKYEIALDTGTKIGSNDSAILALAEKYAAYELSAIKAIQTANREVNTEALLATAVAQNLFNQQS